MVRLFDGGPVVWVIYPLLPWIGVMALGYAFGALLNLEQHRRRRLFLGLGAGLILAFCVLRLLGGYGNPTPFVPQDTIAMSVVSFLNCQKYPPSLAYLLMTLGPAIALLGLLDREPGRIGRLFVVFGRVPLLYYVVHLYLIHVASRVFYLVHYGEALSLADVFRSFQGLRPLPEWYGHSLWLVYTAWILCVAALYPLCTWFAAIKRRRSARWLSYL